MLSIDQLLILVPLFVISIGLHEAAHAYAVDYFGDPTPASQGRLTLNPLAHLDPMGTLMLVFVGFGWGRSVLYNPNNLKSEKLSLGTMEQIIAAAGPLANLAQVIFFVLLMVLTLYVPLPASFNTQSLMSTLQLGALLNALLMLLNLTPIPPLDGSKVIRPFLPYSLRQQFDALEPYGFVLLLALFFLPGVRDVYSGFLYGGSQLLIGFLMGPFI